MSKVDVLSNNAGVSQPPRGSISKQGIELQLATNCLGLFLLTAAVLDAAPGTVRVVWISSEVVELSASPKGMTMSELTNPPKDGIRGYVNSKLGELVSGGGDGTSVWVRAASRECAQNPGAANTNLLRNVKWMKVLSWPLLHSAELATHTEIYAGMSPHLGLENNSAYIIPWGRIHQAVAPNLVAVMKSKEEGRKGLTEEFWDFCEERTNDYM